MKTEKVKKQGREDNLKEFDSEGKETVVEVIDEEDTLDEFRLNCVMKHAMSPNGDKNVLNEVICLLAGAQCNCGNHHRCSSEKVPLHCVWVCCCIFAHKGPPLLLK